MAINNIPGVGPSNADVANAVAAVVPDSADITAAVPTAAQIATAVAAPSAATIAAAVAAPSSATIASAVAAAVPTRAQIQTDITNLGNAYNGPSAATIASTTAASVPTLAQINTAVSTNASPFGGTWTTVYNNQSVTGASSVTATGLGSYKYLKVLYNLWLTGGAGSAQLNLRLNGDTGANYYYSFLKRVNSTSTIDSYADYYSSQIGFNYVAQDFSGQCTGTLELINPQSGSFKIVEGKHGRSRESGVQGVQYGLNAGWFSNAVITSLTIFNNSANFAGGTIVILGAN